MGNLNEFFDTGRNALDDVERAPRHAAPRIPAVLRHGGRHAGPAGRRRGGGGQGGGSRQAALGDLAALPGMHGLLRVAAARRAPDAGKADPRRHLARLPRDPDGRRRAPGRSRAQGGDEGQQGQVRAGGGRRDPDQGQRHLLQDRRPYRDRPAQGMRGRRRRGDRHRLLRLLGRHALDRFPRFPAPIPARPVPPVSPKSSASR
jgi:hypothetical protein